jgi:hypothetical protein
MYPPPLEQPGYAQPADPLAQPYAQPQYPYGQPQQYGQYGQPAGYPQYQAYQPQRTNVLAIVALVLAVVGLAPVGAVLGHVARRQIKRTGETGDGVALAAIIVGWTLTGLFLVGCCVVGLLAINAPSVSG